MNRSVFVLFLLLVLMCSSCRVKSDYKNEYYDRAKGLYTQVVASPKTPEPFEQLLADTNSPDEWRRHYAIAYLGMLGSRNIVEPAQRKQIIEVLRTMLVEGNPEHRRVIVEAIRDMGNEAVMATFPELIQLVEAREENDFNWAAAEALGKVRSSPATETALAALLLAACEPQSDKYPPGTPELRVFAASALLELIEANKLPARQELLQLKAHLPSPELAAKVDALLARPAQSTPK